MTAQPEKIAPSKEESALETEATALPEISEAATDLSEIVTPIQTTDHLEEKETPQTMIDLSVAIEMLPAATDLSVVEIEMPLVAIDLSAVETEMPPAAIEVAHALQDPKEKIGMMLKVAS